MFYMVNQLFLIPRIRYVVLLWSYDICHFWHCIQSQSKLIYLLTATLDIEKKMNSLQMINASYTKNTRFVLQYQWHTKIPRGKEPVIAVLRRVTLYGYRLTVWQRSILHWWHALEYSEWRLVQDRRRSVDIQPQC